MEMHEVQNLYVAFPWSFSSGNNLVKAYYKTIIITENNSLGIIDKNYIRLVLI